MTWYDHSERSPFRSVRENDGDYVLTAKAVDDYLTLYLDGKNPQNPYVAPLLATDFTNLPDTLVITAEYDVLRDEGEAFSKSQRQAISANMFVLRTLSMDLFLFREDMNL